MCEEKFFEKYDRAFCVKYIFHTFFYKRDVIYYAIYFLQEKEYIYIYIYSFLYIFVYIKYLIYLNSFRIYNIF